MNRCQPWPSAIPPPHQGCAVWRVQGHTAEDNGVALAAARGGRPLGVPAAACCQGAQGVGAGVACKQLLVLHILRRQLVHLCQGEGHPLVSDTRDSFTKVSLQTWM
jgi:hypothetical protein